MIYSCSFRARVLQLDAVLILLLIPLGVNGLAKKTPDISRI